MYAIDAKHNQTARAQEELLQPTNQEAANGKATPLLEAVQATQEKLQKYAGMEWMMTTMVRLTVLIRLVSLIHFVVLCQATALGGQLKVIALTMIASGLLIHGEAGAIQKEANAGSMTKMKAIAMAIQTADGQMALPMELDQAGVSKTGRKERHAWA